MSTEVEHIEVSGSNLDIHLSLSDAFFHRFRQDGISTNDNKIIEDVAAILGADDYTITTQKTLALRFNLTGGYKNVPLAFEIGKPEGPLKTASTMLARLG